MKTVLKLPSLFFLKSSSFDFAPIDGSGLRLVTIYLQFLKVCLKVSCLGLDTSFLHRADYHLLYSEYHTSINVVQHVANS